MRSSENRRSRLSSRLLVDTVEDRGKRGHSGSGTPCGLARRPTTSAPRRKPGGRRGQAAAFAASGRRIAGGASTVIALRMHAELCRRRGDDLAVGVHRHRLARLDVEFDAARRAHLVPCAVRAGAERAQHAGKLPDPAELQAVEVEMAVVDLRVGLDDVAAAVVAAVADGDLEGLHLRHFAPVADRRGEGPRLRSARCAAARRSRVGRNASSVWGSSPCARSALSPMLATLKKA